MQKGGDSIKKSFSTMSTRTTASLAIAGAGLAGTAYKKKAPAEQKGYPTGEQQERIAVNE